MGLNEIFHFLFLKVIFAVICGGIIGFERERKHKTAGLKTNILICLGAMIYTVCGTLVEANNGDAGRVIAQIISGIGFLGAGAILNPTANKVVGLTTAAMLWTCAALGILIGLDYGLMAVALTFLIVSITSCVSYVEVHFLNKKKK